MIARDELDKIAQAKNLRIQNAEKDYILEMLLFSISKRASDKLVFKGGTALYKFYGLNRFSEDLDFTLNRGIIDKNFFKLVLQDLDKLNVKGWIKDYEEYKNEINIHLRFAGPLYKGNPEDLCFASINISLRERTLEPKMEFLVSDYNIPSFSIAVMQGAEILAEKIRAILTRDKARDVYDLWFLFKKGIELDEKLVNNKLKVYKLTYAREALLKRISSLENGWKRDLGNLIIGSIPSFEEVVSYIRSNL